MSAEAFWSVAAMPIGLMLCFFPVLIAWALAGRKPPGKDGHSKR